MNLAIHPKPNRLNFVFRWDAGKKVGNGHFIRCLVLSTELLKRGHAVGVLTREMPRFLLSWLNQLGIVTHSIAVESDGLAELSNINQSHKIDWLVIDHYEIEVKWENDARKFASRIMVIDDLANRQHNCELLLDQNVPNCMQKGYAKLVPKQCVQALGWSYLLARPGFYNKIMQHRSGTLIFLGGGDHSQALLSLINNLLKRTECHPLRVLITSDYLPITYWQSLVGDKGDVDCDLVDPVSMYRSAAIAVVRCGFISYELALLGIPAIHIYASDIQAEVAKELENRNMGIALQAVQLQNPKLLNLALQQVALINPKPLNEQLRPGASLVAEILEQINEYQ
jgi:UDP-2,4-diacetamido-2,4,6-trideoxy-beta-L-altropyranose hydrolase